MRARCRKEKPKCDPYKVQIGHHDLEGPSFPRHLHETESDAGEIGLHHKEDHLKLEEPGWGERANLDVGLERTYMNL
jgi:hypothetical protein